MRTQVELLTPSLPITNGSKPGGPRSFAMGIGVLLERTLSDLIVVTAYSTLREEAEENLILTQARARVVREHLGEHFKIDERRIKRMGRGRRFHKRRSRSNPLISRRVSNF